MELSDDKLPLKKRRKSRHSLFNDESTKRSRSTDSVETKTIRRSASLSNDDPGAPANFASNVARSPYPLIRSKSVDIPNSPNPTASSPTRTKAIENDVPSSSQKRFSLNSPSHPSSPLPSTSTSNNNDRTGQERKGDFNITYEVHAPKVFKTNRAKSFKLSPRQPNLDYASELHNLKNALVPFVEKQLQDNPRQALKVHLGIKSQFEVVKPEDGDEQRKDVVVDQPTYYFNSKSRIFLQDDDLEEKLEPLIAPLANQIADRLDKGSGFRFVALEHAQITCVNYAFFPMAKWFPTPQWLARKFATLNPKPPTDSSEACFIYAILAALFPKRPNPNRASHYRKMQKMLNMNGISLPIKNKKDLRLFEKNNPSIAINVFCVDADVPEKPRGFYPYFLSERKLPKSRIANLLLLPHPNGKTYHFHAISNLTKLTRSTVSKHRGSGKVCCPYCIVHVSKSQIEDHEAVCSQKTPQAVKYPPAGSNMMFKNHFNAFSEQFIVYYDFETREVLQKTAEFAEESPLPILEDREFLWVKYPRELVHAKNCDKCSNVKPCIEIQNLRHLHARLELFSYAYIICGFDQEGVPRMIRQRSYYHDSEVKSHFITSLKEDLSFLDTEMSKNVPMYLTEEDQKQHDSATHCSVCEKAFSKEERPQRHHDHLTGKSMYLLCLFIHSFIHSFIIYLFTYLLLPVYFPSYLIVCSFVFLLL